MDESSEPKTQVLLPARTWGSRKMNMSLKRIWAVVSSISVLLGSTVLFAEAANGTPLDEDIIGIGDPIYGDTLPSPERFDRGAVAANVRGGLTNLATWTPAITAGSATAASFDEGRGTVYQASRSSAPASVFANSISDGSSISVTGLPGTSGSWGMTLSDDLLVVGTNGNDAQLPRLIVYKLGDSGALSAPMWDKQLPTSSSRGSYVMAVVADGIDARLFWVGTYDSKGARLYSFDSRTGVFKEYTPGTQWSSEGLRYVRSLTATPQGLFIGMGNPGSVWKLGPNQLRPVLLKDALDGSAAATVYALASTPPPANDENEIDEILIEGEGEGEGGNAAVTEDAPADNPESQEQSSGEISEEPQSGEATVLPSESEVQVDNQPGAESLTSVGEPAASPTSEEELPSLIVAGIDSPASVRVFTEQGESTFSYMFEKDDTVVDRITVDEDRTAWFTVRPLGHLYSLKLDDPSAEPVLRGQPVRGSETRAISASGGVVRGVTGMRQMWSFDTESGEVAQTSLDYGGGAEPSDTAAQKVLAAPGYTLVGGHWRLQAHTLVNSVNIDVPGEPKAYNLVDGKVYAAIYPHASLFSIDVETQVATFVARAEGQTRPRSLTWNQQTRRLYMGTSNSYGEYGGAISVIDPQTGGIDTYENPVKAQMPTALAPIEMDLLVGTSPSGEAIGAPVGSRSVLARWNPTKPGKSVWTRVLPTETAVTGVAAISDDAGEFVFAITNDGRAFALDADTGTVLWQEKLPAAARELRAVGGYVLIRTGTDLVEYFPSRTALTRGLTLASGVRWMDFQKESRQMLAVATVSSDSASATRSFISNPRQVDRDQGINRYATAIAVSQSTFKESAYAVLATGSDFPDALTAGPLAALKHAPVLLTSGASLRSDVLTELRRLGTRTVYIVGGPTVVPRSVEAALRANGYTVKRLWGEDRYQTALAIAEEIRVSSGSTKMPLVLTTGLLYPDALSATPAAARMGGAIILTRGASLDSRTSQYVRTRSSMVATVGSPARSAASKVGVTPRWAASGTDRFETSAMVARRVFPSASRVFVATGLDYPDGLAAGPAAAQSSSPVVLTRSNAIPSAVAGVLAQADQATLIGGTTVLHSGLATKVRLLD